MLPDVRALRSEQWRYALLAVVLAVPVVGYTYWESGGHADLSALFYTSLAAGYLAKRRGLESTPVGTRAGVAAAVPLSLWALGDLGLFVIGLSQPVWFTVLQLWFLAFIFAVIGGFMAVVGGFGALVGGWLAERRGHPGRSAVT